MKYIRKNFKYLFCLVLIFVSFNLYFIFLLPEVDNQYLLYLDLLLSVCLGIFSFVDGMKFYRREKEIEEYLKLDDFIYTELDDLEHKDIMEHDFQVFQVKLNEQVAINQDLQDFFAKWCHEVKIPLSAAMLMNEKIENSLLKLQLKEQLEKMNLYLNLALVSCKVQGAFDDLQIQKLKLKEWVNASIRNNRFFLMNENVNLKIDLHNEYVYSDKTWLVYIIDQLLGNAIKYARENAKIHIHSEQNERSVQLYIKDEGEGIKDYDLPRIFDRGYVGSNHHNGKYKSTGMGLYMVNLMIKKLGHQISVDSQYQQYTCFCITFQNIEKHFNL